MRGFIAIVTFVALIARTGEVRAQTADASSLEGVVTLVDSNRNLLVIQNGEQPQAIQVEGAMPGVQLGERISIEGNFAPYFVTLPDYPARPSGTDVLPSFEAPTDWNNHFVSRARGFLRAPTDGEYTFWILADDEAELLLGSNSDPATARLIASVRHGTWPGMWDRHPEQKSQPTYLRAGERYYMEALHREWRGHDRLAVAWQGPNFEREVIGGEFLSPWHAEGSATNGILYEYWTNCFITRLAMLLPELQDGAVVQVSGAGVKSFGSGRLPAARRVSPGAARPDVRNFARVEVEGTVTFAAADDGVLNFELKEPNARNGTVAARMRVNVLDWEDRLVARLLNRTVRARGVWELGAGVGPTGAAGGGNSLDSGRTSPLAVEFHGERLA